MTSVVIQNIAWAVLFMLIAGITGSGLLVLLIRWLPWTLNRLTPQVDEEREIARGNLAVAQYFGRLVAAGIIGISIVIAAAVLGGMMAGLHGTDVIVQPPPAASEPR